MSGYRNYGFLCLGNPGRGKRGHGKYSGASAVFHSGDCKEPGEQIEKKPDDLQQNPSLVTLISVSYTHLVVNRYDLSKEFPALTLRRTAIKSCVDEMLWIWQKKSNNVNELKSHIWDSWADETGSIGKAYGYQMGVKHQYKEGMMDQTDRVIYDLKNNPYSRRIMTNIYVHQDLHEMNLYPCAYSMTFNVTKEKDSDLSLIHI